MNNGRDWHRDIMTRAVLYMPCSFLWRFQHINIIMKTVRRVWGFCSFPSGTPWSVEEPINTVSPGNTCWLGCGEKKNSTSLLVGVYANLVTVEVSMEGAQMTEKWSILWPRYYTFWNISKGSDICIWTMPVITRPVILYL